MVRMVEEIYSKINEIKKEAIQDEVPIMQDDTIDFILEYIARNNIRKILEIGTATGYSSIMMASSNPNIVVTTIEKNDERYKKAIKNIKKMELEDRITPIFNNALLVSLKDKYDLIVIDASKSKNIEFFKKFEKNLEIDGRIITDNLNFHGFVDKDLSEIPSRNVRGLVTKIRAYKEFLEKNDKYETNFYDIGDGISVSERRN